MKADVNHTLHPPPIRLNSTVDTSNVSVWNRSTEVRAAMGERRRTGDVYIVPNTSAECLFSAAQPAKNVDVQVRHSLR